MFSALQNTILFCYILSYSEHFFERDIIYVQKIENHGLVDIAEVKRKTHSKKIDFSFLNIQAIPFQAFINYHVWSVGYVF